MATMPAVSKRVPSSATHRSICEIIRTRRIELGWTQESAAKALGVSTPRWCEIENGRFNLTLPLLERVASALTLSLHVSLKPRRTSSAA